MSDVAAAERKRLILIPTDGSSHSHRAFLWYMDNLRKPSDKLVIAYVVEAAYSMSPIYMGMEGLHTPVIQRTLQQDIQSGKIVCQRLIEKAAEENVDTQGIILVNNRPGQSLVDAIKEYKIGMVVMGNRGLGMLRRTVLGSVSEFVLHHAHIPTIIVPPE